MARLKLWLRDGRRNPGRFAFLLFSLSVAIGAALAATALNAAVSWRDLPFVEPASLVKLEVRSSDASPRWWSWPELQAVTLAAGPSFSAMAAYSVADVGIASDAGRPPDALLATMVSRDFFHALGIGVSVGRLFTDAEHLVGAPCVVLLSHELWQRRYGGDPLIVGRTIDLSTPEYLGEQGGRHLVVGVLGPQTWLFWRRFDLVMPFRAAPRLLSDPRTPLIEHVVARLNPHATVSSAQASAPVLTSAVRAVGAGATDTVVVEQLRSALFRDLQPRLRLVMTMAIVVVLLAAVNVLVAASTAALERQRDTAVRLALGASPLELARDAGVQMMLTLGCALILALVVSSTFLSAILSIMPGAWLARVPGGATSVRVETVGFAASAAAVISLAVLAALWTRRQIGRLAVSPLLDAIQHTDAPIRHRWRAAIVASEVALCTAVVLVATTLGLQLWKLQRVDLGVRAERTSVFWINASASRYADPTVRMAYFDRLLGDVSGVAGVEAVGGIDLTFQFDWQTTMVRPGSGRETVPLAALDRAATPSYLDVSGLSVLDGRWLQPGDRAGSSDVVAISSSLAEQLWPGQRAVGQTIQFDAGKNPKPMTVVGVVTDVRHSPEAHPARIVYRSLAQAAPPWLYVLVRTGSRVDQASDLRSAVWRVDPDQAVDGPWTVQTWVEDTTAFVGFLANLTAILAGIAIVLAAAGLQGLTTYWVQAARRELGIRRAVGASHRDIVAWFARRWGVVVMPAVALGILLQFVLLRTIVSQVEAVHAASPGHLAIGTLIVVAYASGAASAALMRALRTDERVLIR